MGSKILDQGSAVTLFELSECRMDLKTNSIIFKNATGEYVDMLSSCKIT